MDRDERVRALAARLKETAEAHREAFRATDGADPDWALWYAEHLAPAMEGLLGRAFTKTELVRCLAALDEEQAARAPEADWTQYYASQLVECFVPTADETLALYFYPACPFCQLVLRALRDLGIEDRVELRDIWQDDAHRRDLVEARGRRTVPVLRCTSAEADRWMPESRDIVRYLRERFGGGGRP